MKRPGLRHEAVSPVVGVMLMLAVTIMIAAVVSTFAGSFSDTSEKVPQCSFKVRVNLLENRTYFDHAGGDPVSLNTIQVVFISGEKKTTLTKADVGKNCINFTQVGSDGNTIKAGDTFYIEGETPTNTLTDHSGIKYGKLVLKEETEVTWMVIDTRSSKTISMGSMYL
ncbi:MAG: type IV pilin N-terminal domain-containing protein [Methanoregula sp.]|nr:type IV pilin N-terminal domain-containing protein [Methanoregula sp.]